MNVSRPFLIGLLIAGWMRIAASTVDSSSAPLVLPKPPWYGLHMFAPSTGGLAKVKRAVSDHLAPMGVNVIVLEVNYQFPYTSHPELSEPGGLTRGQARELADLCRSKGILLIPQFNCLGHQSWSKRTFSLLTRYPELDETPRVPKDNTGIYCRSWCPLHPKINEVVLPMLDELIDAFGSSAFHVGMDEVFLIGSEQCPRCGGRDPAELFARAVGDLHAHLAGRRRQTVLMWGDRLIDGRTMVYGPWESSANRTAPAIDRIPKDIIICDWHYTLLKDYPSVRYFQEKGFRVWPAGWRTVKATEALIDCSLRQSTERMIGHLFTTWTSSDQIAAGLLGQDRALLSAESAGAIDCLRAGLKRLRSPK